MSAKWKVLWSEDDMTHEERFENSEHVLDYIDRLHGRDWSIRPVVEVARGVEGGPSMSIVVGGDETVVTFEKSADPPYYISLGDPTRDGVSPMFFHGGQGIDQLARNLVPWEHGRGVLVEFLASGKRSERIEWEQL